MNLFQSQHGEDAWITEHLILPEKGIFVEVGAFDGILSSNTYYFEQKGWTGLLIEADPLNAGRCFGNRAADLVSCACGTDVGLKTFYINQADRGLSGLEREGKPCRVMVRRLDALIRIYLLKEHVDLLSIDTEGTELDVWESIGSIRPTIVIMEYNTLGLPLKDEAIIKQMVKDGYFQVHRTETNLIFLREGSKQSLK